jgi:hypothetical protein
MSEEIKTLQQTHGTIVLGWDSGGRLTFAKTFDFGENNETEREQALEAFAFVTQKCHTWEMGATESILDQSRLKVDKDAKSCPNCLSDDVIWFTSDLDLCKKCGQTF